MGGKLPGLTPHVRSATESLVLLFVTSTQREAHSPCALPCPSSHPGGMAAVVSLCLLASPAQSSRLGVQARIYRSPRVRDTNRLTLDGKLNLAEHGDQEEAELAVTPI
jgi:hypothetical protein